MRAAGYLIVVTSLLIGAMSARAQAPRCKERCEAERARIKKQRERCLKAGESLPRGQGAKHRVTCRQKFVPPRCDGLPRCPPAKKEKAHPPGLELGPVIFTNEKNGPALSKPRYAPGGQLFFRIEVKITSKPGQSQLWLELDLGLMARGPQGKHREVIRWDKYLQKRKFLDRWDRGVPLKYTLHGGALLPATFKPGSYLAEVRVKERSGGFVKEARAPFFVKRGRAGSKKKSR